MFLEQVCGPPGMMNAISGDKPSPKDQGEVSISVSELIPFDFGMFCKVP